MLGKWSIFLVFMIVICGAERIHERKCREYNEIAKKIACDESRKVPLVPVETGGNFTFLASNEEFPHSAKLGYYNHEENNETDWGCDGILISDRYVLTPAYCLRNEFLGDKNFVRLSLTSHIQKGEAQPDDYRIKAVHRHPDYIKAQSYYNIALVELDRNVVLGKTKLPACLPTADDNAKERFIKTYYWGTPQKYNLVKLVQDKTSEVECEQKYSNYFSWFKKGIQKETQICTTSPIGSFYGNLHVFHKTFNCMYVIVGLAGWPIGNPSVATRVYPFIDWIESIIWQ